MDTFAVEADLGTAAWRCRRDGAGSPGSPCVRGARAQNAEGRSRSRPSKPSWQPGSEGPRGWGPLSAFCFIFQGCSSLRTHGPSDGAGTGSGGAAAVWGHSWGERKVFLPLSLACEHCGAPHLLLKCSKHSI